MKILFLFALVILAGVFSINEVHALSPEDCGSNQVWQNNECIDNTSPPKNDLNLHTDKVLYGQGDTVVITGMIPNIENFPSTSNVTIIVRMPDNNILTIDQVHPNEDGSFQTSLKADGSQFMQAGDYAVFANFAGLKSQITFGFTGGTGEIISYGDSQSTICPSGQTLINGKCEDDSQIADSIIVTTDKASYEDGDTILVIGEVRDLLSGYPISLRVIAPNGDLVTVVQVEVNSDKTFSTEITPDELWRHAGTYTIKVLYGTQSRTDQTTFTFGDAVNDIPPTTDDLPSEITINTALGSNTPGCEETVNGCFIPKVASVALGGIVIFSNTDDAAHTFTAGTGKDGPSGAFDSGLVVAGSSYEWTPTTEGEVPYYCMVHPWMAGIIFVGEGVYIPPTEDNFDLQVTMGNQVYDLLDTATMNLSINGVTNPQNVALEISGPSGTSIISRSFMVDSQGVPFEFRIDENFKTGTYKVVATTNNDGNTITDTAYFKVKSQYNSFKITSVQVTDQQGNPSTLQAGEMGFIKVNLDASKAITTLVTVNLFDSDLTSIGIGSIKTTLSSGNSEIILSFMIPSDVAVGASNVYVNAFSDWPSNEGIPLTDEVSVVENIE